VIRSIKLPVNHSMMVVMTATMVVVVVVNWLVLLLRHDRWRQDNNYRGVRPITNTARCPSSATGGNCCQKCSDAIYSRETAVLPI